VLVAELFHERGKGRNAFLPEHDALFRGPEENSETKKFEPVAHGCNFCKRVELVWKNQFEAASGGLNIRRVPDSSAQLESGPPAAGSNLVQKKYGTLPSGANFACGKFEAAGAGGDFSGYARWRCLRISGPGFLGRNFELLPRIKAGA
jgi:hypothetical protein